MKCAAHNSEAVAICAWCGRAVCSVCGKPSASGRMVCSDDCAAALTREAKAMESILRKSLQSAWASAFYYFLCCAVLGAAAVGAWYYLLPPFLIWFCVGCSLVFLVSGLWYAAIAKKSSDRK
jgi:predicted nucleic acid-binding Zn ribbon protein